MSITRRSFLAGLFAAPAIVRASVIMPVQAIILPPPFLPGDLVKVKQSAFRGGPFVGSRVVLRVEGDFVVTHRNTYYRDHRDEEKVPLAPLELSEGLPGNRTNNPSMRHRLFRPEGQIGLAYPEDLQDWRMTTPVGRAA